MRVDPAGVLMSPRLAVDGDTGLLIHDEAAWTNWEPLELAAGTRFVPHEGVTYRVWCYESRYDESLAREYSYDAESNWTTIAPELGSAWTSEPWVLPVSCFVRVSVRRASTVPEVGKLLRLGLALTVDAVEVPEPEWPAFFAEEAERVCSRVEAVCEPGDVVLLALTDVHYSTGCIWPQTAQNIREVAARVHPDAIVQLGDVSDGIAPLHVTRSFAGRVLGDLEACGVPVYSCVGNHDVNYFKGNAERLGARECAELYTGRSIPYYYEDFAAQHLRCFFLHSFDPTRSERYGYDDEQYRWFRRVLRQTPRGWSVLVFSHITPLAEIHYWSDTILNGPRLLKTLDRFNRRRKGGVLAVVHGHSHVDQIWNSQSYPLVCIGTAKFEDFEECKPQDSTTPRRFMGEPSQDLWDVLVVKPARGRIEFIRFGAGEDRQVGGA